MLYKLRNWTGHDDGLRNIDDDYDYEHRDTWNAGDGGGNGDTGAYDCHLVDFSLALLCFHDFGVL